ncbi:MAG TPA: ABC transporter ATP-binding protein/permease [Clostridiales bacterium]|nr:ABC transporter ATP-binding protein/permease [Clostridiales bacterium]
MTGKIRQKVRDGSLREMWREAKWMFTYIRRYRAVVGIHILLGILGTALSLLSSVAMKTLIDVVTGFQTGAIFTAAAWMAGMLLGSAAMQAAASRIAAVINIRVQNGIQAEVYDRMLRTDWASLEQFRSGDLLNRLNTDVTSVSGGVTGLLPSFVTAAVQFLGSLMIILCYDPVMALIALIGAPLSVLCSRTLVRRMRSYNRRMKDISSEVMSFHEDSLRNLTSIKAFGIMDGFRDRMCAMQGKYRETYLDYNRFSVIAGFVMSIVGLLVSAGCFGWGVYRLWTHAISYGAMMMFLQLTTMLRSAFSSLIGLVPTAVSITTSAGRLMAIADLPEEPGARERVSVPEPCTVELRDVTFAYPGGEPVLEHVDFRARPGEVVALTGASGEGKTTMIRLMLGLVRPEHGSVCLTGADGQCLPVSAATRAAFSYVPQGNTVFAGTIADNLRMVRPEATDAELIAALETACAYDFVRQLPDGIYARTGELGHGLSEGQAQRIAVARAVLRGAPVLLLDEATSALDEATEQRMLENLMHSGRVQTCVLITHRAATAERCPRRYTLRGTRLTEETAACAL